MKKLIEEIAIVCDVSERKLRALLTDLGLAQMLNEARRMQVGEAYQEERMVFDSSIVISPDNPVISGDNNPNG